MSKFLNINISIENTTESRRSLLGQLTYDLCRASGKPSTWFPPGDLYE